ncbi:MAG TPA: lipase maturation factor family protein [Candidatus Sulfotelmatobacter sp.]|nr:lipase maturation factor family protein [Candidatus Sulfotelmatobacter sp.]
MNDSGPSRVIRWLFDPRQGATNQFLPRWLFLRAIGLIYFSAFFSLLFQIRGLIGPDGVLPASEYLDAVAKSAAAARFWYAPTLFWLSTSSHMLMAVCWLGLAASLLVVFNIFPRTALFVCFVSFLSFVAAAGEFSGYQSDGMLLEAGFIVLFVAPMGFRPRLAATQAPLRASIFLLLWEWFRIYFESGVAKIASGDPEWRRFTAMDEYYQNGPLPTWIGWYMQHLPHWFHATTAFLTLALELVLVFMLFLPRRWRIVCFFIVTPWQLVVILTANYTFLNYLVLALGIFLLDDRFLQRLIPPRWKHNWTVFPLAPVETAVEASNEPSETIDRSSASGTVEQPDWTHSTRHHLANFQLTLTCVMFAWLFYASTTSLVWMLWSSAPLPGGPVVALEPFRIADRYGLFARMTRGRYEIEFQGSMDGQTWTTYQFRNKPQDPHEAPRIYAPYQPRFDWNLWFASLSDWRSDPVVVRTEERLLSGSPDVVALFASNPFPQPPHIVRAVIWQYWFSTREDKSTQGIWWTRQQLGLYAPTLQRQANGKLTVLEWPSATAPRE